MVLDEVTSYAGWWRLIKGYVDLGVFEDDVLILTGSSSLRLKGEVELFPGRTGKGISVEVLPLSFRGNHTGGIRRMCWCWMRKICRSSWPR